MANNNYEVNNDVVTNPTPTAPETTETQVTTRPAAAPKQPWYKHPVVRTGAKILAGIGALAGAFALGKHFGGNGSDDTIETVDYTVDPTITE